MCNPAGVAFVERMMPLAPVAGGEVLEVGSFFGTGPTARPIVVSRGPASYLGVDIQRGPGVDRIARVENLEREFGESSFDVLIATELVEHVLDWRSAFRNMKRVLRPGGVLLLTTRSLGYPYHAAPHDYWRYELEDMRDIFADMEVISIEADPSMPGVFAAVRRPEGFVEREVDEIELHSMVHGRRVGEIGRLQALLHRFRSPRRLASWLLPEGLKRRLRG